jgi:purine-binding chemotaxis protein CheW
VRVPAPLPDDALAAEPAPEAPERLLAFRLDAREYAVPIGSIVGIVPYRPATPIPGLDGAVLGILPLRGRMVTVVEARRRLGLPDSRDGGMHIIVFDRGGDLVGLRVDAVSRVCGSGPERLDPEALFGRLL